jgi:hypothetical protein
LSGENDRQSAGSLIRGIDKCNQENDEKLKQLNYLKKGK